MKVFKRNGDSVDFDPEKVNRVVLWACEGLAGVSASEVVINAQLKLFDGISTETIHETLVKSAQELITEQTPNYQYVASRLLSFDLRKKVYGTYAPKHIKEIVVDNTEKGVYRSDLLGAYSDDEWNAIEDMIDHERDHDLSIAGLTQVVEKYLCQNRSTNVIFETPQVMYILMSATGFMNESPDVRLGYVKEFYDACSRDMYFSLPSPDMAGVRTVNRQYSSCVGIHTADDLDSIGQTGPAIVQHVSKRAGLGLNVGAIRAMGSKVGPGEVKHTGLVPFLKYFDSAVKSCCLRPDMYVEILDVMNSKTKRIQISDLNPGMEIVSWANGTTVFKKVIDVWETEVPYDQQVALNFTNRTVVNCSVNHPIMVLENDLLVEKKPLDLTGYDKVVTENGYTYLYSRELEQTNSPEYIDITVEETNVFFTSSKVDDEMVLTHNSQGGLRKASATVNYVGWHKDFRDLIVLKNNQGTEESRVRDLDYCVQICKMFYQRWLDGGNITLLSPHLPGLYEAYFRDINEFYKLYEQYENDPTVEKEVISADEYFEILLDERNDTARIYLSHVDNVAEHSPFETSIDPIYMTNLCVAGDTEIDVDVSGEVKRVKIKDLEGVDLSDVTVRSFDTETGKVEYRAVTDFAKVSDSSEVLKITDEYSGKSIVCTPYHEVYTTNRGYVLAKDLLEDDSLLIA